MRIINKEVVYVDRKSKDCTSIVSALPLPTAVSMEMSTALKSCRCQLILKPEMNLFRILLEMKPCMFANLFDLRLLDPKSLPSPSNQVPFVTVAILNSYVYSLQAETILLALLISTAQMLLLLGQWRRMVNIKYTGNIAGNVSELNFCLCCQQTQDSYGCFISLVESTGYLNKRYDKNSIKISVSTLQVYWTTPLKST